MSYALICPGQGSQYIGMGKEFYDFDNDFKEKYDIASNILGYDISKISFDGPIDTLKKTQYTQPAIFIHSYLSALLIKNYSKIKFSIGAGHSLGEITALAVANSISYVDAINLIKVRSNSMAEAGEKIPGAMAAIIGANDEQLAEICDQSGIVVPANINAPNQVVISGETEAVKLAIKDAKLMGLRRVIPLNVSGAFHSPLMFDARDELINIINKIKFNDADFPVVQNVTAKPSMKKEGIKKNLILQLENPVKWSQSIKNIYKIGINKFIECGPGKVLSGLNRKILKNSINYSINTPQNMDQFES